ncbi:MAG: protein-L-isoaspartate(D-aspartate) O-methyltransferase [Alphaproteobacteria bacterium]
MPNQDQQAQFILALRQAAVQSQAVIDAMLTIPREAFIDPSQAHLAYEDVALEIDEGQTISQPSVIAKMSDALEITKRHRVLEIGTGCGYQCAILAKLARFVYSIERIRRLHDQANRRLLAMGIANIALNWGDGMEGWNAQAPFDRIILTAAAAKPPAILLDQLAVGGIMVYPFGETGKRQQLIKIIKQQNGIDEILLDHVQFVPILEGRAHHGG